MSKLALVFMAQLLVEEGLDLGAVVGVDAEVWQSFAHADFGDVEHQVEVVPELLFEGL